VTELSVGVDGWRRGWVAIALRAGRFDATYVFKSFADVLSTFPNAAAIGVDMPIGIPDAGVRAADIEARALLGAGHSSVFVVPPRSVLDAPDHATASALYRSLTGKGLSKQSFDLRKKILEIDALVGPDEMVIEVHPEVSFRSLAGQALKASKKSWVGTMRRRALLAEAGILLPEDIGPAGVTPVDDILDAAVAAWSARRYARREAKSLPAAPPADAKGRLVAIWY
jgi:predicted RNase H-like nuclease